MRKRRLYTIIVTANNRQIIFEVLNTFEETPGLDIRVYDIEDNKLQIKISAFPRTLTKLMSRLTRSFESKIDLSINKRVGRGIGNKTQTVLYTGDFTKRLNYIQSKKTVVPKGSGAFLSGHRFKAKQEGDGDTGPGRTKKGQSKL